MPKFKVMQRYIYKVLVQTSYLNTRRCLFYLFCRSFLTHVKPSFGEKVARCKVACAWFSCLLGFLVN